MKRRDSGKKRREIRDAVDARKHPHAHADTRANKLIATLCVYVLMPLALFNY